VVLLFGGDLERLENSGIGATGEEEVLLPLVLALPLVVLVPAGITRPPTTGALSSSGAEITRPPTTGASSESARGSGAAERERVS
jgi:hypothetical protein